MEPVDPSSTRRELMARGLAEDDLPTEPLALLDQWVVTATELGLHNPNAMAVATADEHGVPSVRNVLLRGRPDEGLVFFTNYQSIKGQHLAANPMAEALFTWLPLERQIRVKGSVRQVDAQQSDAYFASRDRRSRISAIASAQSRPVESRAELQRRHAELTERFEGIEPPRPEHWGGYVLTADRVEFWQGRDFRLHDRLVYTRTTNGWEIQRLQP